MSTSTANEKAKATALAAIATIHKIDGFDPTALAVEYIDLNTKEKRQRLPVMAQIAWFRLEYPEGRISVTARLTKDYYVGHARIYRNYMDPPDCFLAEATASRKYDPEKPTVSPREWAQTAALGIALRNAGFGLQFHAAGDAFDQLAVDELGNLTEAVNSSAEGSEVHPVDQPAEKGSGAAVEAKDENTVPAEAIRSESAEETPPENAFEQALKLPCPIAKYSGKTLGDLLQLGETGAIVWIAEKFKKDPAIAAGARLICERSLDYSA